MKNQWQTGTCKFGWCRAVTGLPQGLGGKESARPVQETQEMWVQSLGWEDPLEEEKAIFLLAKSIDRGAWWATVHGTAKESDTTDRHIQGRKL